MKSIIYRAAAAAASKQGIPSSGLAALASAQVNSDQEQSNSETSQLQEACSSKSVSSTANVTQPATSTQKQQLLRQVMLQDLDSNAFNEVTQQLKGDQQRQNAESKAFAVLQDLWQQAEPPTSIKGHELELINSYDAMLRYCVHFKSIMQQQQQQAAAALEQSSGQPSKSRPRRRSTASSASSSTIIPSSSSAVTATPPVQPATATTAQSGAAGGLSHQTVTSWRRTREAVLNELRVRDLAAMIETAGWEIPIGKLDKSTNRRKSRTKADYIEVGGDGEYAFGYLWLGAWYRQCWCFSSIYLVSCVTACVCIRLLATLKDFVSSPMHCAVSSGCSSSHTVVCFRFVEVLVIDR